MWSQRTELKSLPPGHGRTYALTTTWSRLKKYLLLLLPTQWLLLQMQNSSQTRASLYWDWETHEILQGSQMCPCCWLWPWLCQFCFEGRRKVRMIRWHFLCWQSWRGLTSRKIFQNFTPGFCMSDTNCTYLHARTVEVETCCSFYSKYPISSVGQKAYDYR